MKMVVNRASVFATCAFMALPLATNAMAFGTSKGTLDPADPKIAEKIAKQEGVEMVAHQLLVKFNSENAAAERQIIFKKYGGRELERVGSTPLFLVQFPEDSNILEIKGKLEHLEGISYAEPNLVMRTMPAQKKKAK
jgi:hypothetical protein